MSRRSTRSAPRRGPWPGAGPRRPLGAGDLQQLLHVVARAPREVARDARAQVLREPAAVVVQVASALVHQALAGLWAQGWQPAEVVWQARRRSVGAGEAAEVAVLAAARSWAEAELHPAWRAQLDALLGGGARASPAGGEHASTLGGPEAVVDLAAVLLALPPVEVLLPVPGRPDVAVASASAADGAEGIDAKVLERVRALLAKAESTTFEAEAQAFTAKAHELMTRHALEHALVHRGPDVTDRPVARRLCIDEPYADAKAHLLAVIAEACRSTAVLLGGLQMVTLVGYASDLAEVDVLFTSLLVQAQGAIDELARAAPAGSRERSRGFRSSFLRGFAHRIGDRLHVAGEATVADLDRSSGGALVPVMAERREAVDQHVTAMHPRLRTKHVAAPTDRLGWYAGRQAADRADLPWDRLTSGPGR